MPEAGASEGTRCLEDVCGTTTVAALLVAALCAAVPPSLFRVNVPRFDHQRLARVGQADWHAGEGRAHPAPPRGAGGGWLSWTSPTGRSVFCFVPLHGRLRVGVCSALRRRERHEGYLCLLTQETWASYRVTLDCQGQENQPRQAAPATWAQFDIAKDYKPPQPQPPGRRGAGRSGQGNRPAPVFEPEQWNTNSNHP